MDNAPDRIWVWKTQEGKEQWYDSLCHWMGVGAVEYVRADLASPLGSECGHPFCGMKCGEPTDAELDRAALDRPKVRALVEAERAATHRAGYDLARDDAAKAGRHLVTYDVMMKKTRA